MSIKLLVDGYGFMFVRQNLIYYWLIRMVLAGIVFLDVWFTRLCNFMLKKIEVYKKRMYFYYKVKVNARNSRLKHESFNVRVKITSNIDG